MLTVSKASAGSGKTFQLARQYIEYLITVSEDGAKPRLRTTDELQDSASHILAITFTNKATSEMRERIVANLAELANPDLSPKDTDYMEHFCNITGATAEKIRQTAADALSVLLNNYSDFRISTIDSFFQTVLRTFAYETGLDDAYDLELDSKYVARAAIDATLTQMNHPQHNSQTSRWIRHLMSWSADEGSKWNLFEKKESKHSLYAMLLARVTRMQDERFDRMRADLVEWFEAHPDFLDHLDAYELEQRKKIRQLHTKAVEAAKALGAELGEFDPSELNKSIAGYCRIVADSKPKDGFNKTIYETVAPSKIFKSDFYKKNVGRCSRGLELGQAFYDALGRWNGCLSSEAMLLWREYVANLRYLHLAVAVCSKASEMLREERTVALGQTNAMLSKIIANDDTPFIYERLGTKLDHYLIDEFQDTSLMQWANLKPLLEESLGEGKGNLIIGDAKQSIYRFRGAEPSVITESVPNDLRAWMANPDADDEKNTNYRSSLRIVQFNNLLFKCLADFLDTLREDAQSDGYFKNLYANVVQEIKDTSPRGYVEVRRMSKKLKDPEGNDTYEHFRQIGPLIQSILDRGYRKRDIAILVRSNIDGASMVQSLLDYNAAIEDPARRISFISEESLLIGSSPSIEALLSVLEMIAEGTDAGDADKNNTDANKKLFNCRLRLFSAAHRDQYTKPQMLQAFLNDRQARTKQMTELIPMRSMPLPWLVERIIELYLSDDDRRRDTSFIAAFQDLVIDFCEHNPADVSTFLQWWAEKGATKSITASEDADDVRIMTIHKSKGLEFPCVILPRVSETYNIKAFDKDNAEWIWVKPQGEKLDPPIDNSSLPPMIPLLLTSQLDKVNSHRQDYLRELRKARMDWLNNLYVGCTRAVDELYMYIPEKGTIINQLGECENSDASPLLPDANDVKFNVSDDILFTMGCYCSPNVKNKKKKDKTVREVVKLDNYFVRSPSDFLHFRLVEAADPEQRDVREEGTLMHAIMAEVITADDIDRAVRRRVVSGELTQDEGVRISTMLRQKIADPQVANWFAPGQRVITERNLLERDSKNRRPDRIVIAPTGETTVIDYKFGNNRNDTRYKKQLRTYAALLRDASPAGAAGRVEGYVWYVNLGILLKA